MCVTVCTLCLQVDSYEMDVRHPLGVGEKIDCICKIKLKGAEGVGWGGGL